MWERRRIWHSEGLLHHDWAQRSPTGHRHHVVGFFATHCADNPDSTYVNLDKCFDGTGDQCSQLNSCASGHGSFDHKYDQHAHHRHTWCYRHLRRNARSSHLYKLIWVCCLESRYYGYIDAILLEYLAGSNESSSDCFGAERCCEKDHCPHREYSGEDRLGHALFDYQ
jgi:hypothetical protein